jgi:hypothetical protein
MQVQLLGQKERVGLESKDVENMKTIVPLQIFIENINKFAQ